MTMRFAATLGEGVPVDFSRLLELSAPGAGWSHQGPDGEGADQSPNELALATASTGKALNILDLRFAHPEVTSFSFWTSRQSADASLRITFASAPQDVTQLDRLAALAAHASVHHTDPGYRQAMATEWGAAQRRRMAAFIGIGEVQWFGRDIVELMGGDETFEALPEGWAVRTDFDQWRLTGLDPDESPNGYDPRSWSPRERAIIDHLGRHFFLDLDNQSVPTTRLPHFTAPYDVYLWRNGELVIESPDGTTRPAPTTDLVDLPEPNPMPDLAALFLEQIEDTPLRAVLDDPDENPAYWVGEWLLGQQHFDTDTAIRLVAAWLGQHATTHHNATWTNTDGHWTIISAGGSEHDPVDAVRTWLDNGPPLTRFVDDLGGQP